MWQITQKNPPKQTQPHQKYPTPPKKTQMKNINIVSLFFVNWETIENNDSYLDYVVISSISP